MEALRVDLEGQGYALNVLAINSIGSEGTINSLISSCKFDIFQDKSPDNVWKLLGGGKDDIFIYREGGRLAPGGYLKIGGPVNTNLSTPEGYQNVRGAIIAASALGPGEPCPDCADFQEEARIEGAPAEPLEISSVVTLDGSSSSPGPGSPGPLTFLWKVISGPGSIEGPDRESTVRVKGLASGSVAIELDVQTAGQESCGAPSSARVSLDFDDLSGYWIRCDANGDRANDISDAVFTLSHLFLGGPAPSCPGSADCNADGTEDISDAVYDLNFLFLGWVAPPSPYPACERFQACPANCQ